MENIRMVKKDKKLTARMPGSNFLCFPVANETICMEMLIVPLAGDQTLLSLKFHSSEETSYSITKDEQWSLVL